MYPIAYLIEYAILLDLEGPKMKPNLLISQRKKPKPRKIKEQSRQTWLASLTEINRRRTSPREHRASWSLWQETVLLYQ